MTYLEQKTSISPIGVAIVNYPDAMQSAVLGLNDVFALANTICTQQHVKKHFSVTVCNSNDLDQLMTGENPGEKSQFIQIVIVPPAIEGQYYLKPSESLLLWLNANHKRGAIICSACAGAFILAAAGLLQGRRVTTHWNLATLFSKRHPDIHLAIDKILINDGDIITAGGLMSWMDLGLELVVQFAQPSIMRQLGKLLVVDTGKREQRYYQSFSPKLDHGNKTVLRAQHYLQKHYHEPISVSHLASICCLSERTLLRHFVKMTGFKPLHYLQNLRIQKACEYIETTTDSYETIALKVGYEDTSAFRKTFVKLTGLTPRDFRKRFSQI